MNSFGHLRRWRPMLSVAFLLWARANAFKQQENSTEIYEIRIYENAPPGTKATLNEAFDRVLRELKNCFAQLDSDVDWIEFDSPLLVFLTTKEVPSASTPMQYATLHLMCASNMMRSIAFSLHVTRRNRHPPRFSAESYKFCVPNTLSVGLEVGHINVQDHDPIIYNSQFQLNLVPLDADSSLYNHWSIHKNGSLNVKASMTDLNNYEEVEFKVVAYDFGSPQLFSIAKVVVVPVSVSPPRNVRVNVANREYQIFEWDPPEYGIAHKVRLDVFRNDRLVHSVEVSGEETVAMSRAAFDSNAEYVVSAAAIDSEGETPSEGYRFKMLESQLHCRGRCADGGRPMCYYAKTHKIEQFRDPNGLHCLCYSGYSGAQCDMVERCDAERSVALYGGVSWPSTYVNHSGAVPCPYNSDGTKLERRCLWDAETMSAKWENLTQNDICKKQSHVLVHLGVLANYVSRPDTTATGFAAVQRFLTSILNFPAFDSNATSIQFDDKIAEHTAQVLDSMLSRDIRSLPGNVTQMRAELAHFVSEFSHRLPTPYSLESIAGGLLMRSQHWIAGADSFPTPMSGRCYVHLPKAVRNAVVNMVCMRNNSLFDVPTLEAPALTRLGTLGAVPTASDLPALLIESQNPRDPLRLPVGTRALIALRPPPEHFQLYGPTAPNYTCAYFDEREKAWSTRGVVVLSRNFEGGMVLCESAHLSLFTLLPESLFKDDESYISMMINLLPLVTTFVALIVDIFLLGISLCQRNADPAASLFLMAVSAVHGIQFSVFSMPHFFNLRHLDGYVYIGLQYAVLASAALFALLNSALYSKVAELSGDFRESAHLCTRLLLVAVFAIVAPAVSAYFTQLNRAHLFLSVVSRSPVPQPFNWTFVFAFALPFLLYTAIAVAYAMAAICGSRRWAARSRLGELKARVHQAMGGAATTALLLIMVFYGDAFLFFERNTFFKNATFSALQLFSTGLLFFHIGFLNRIQSYFRHSSFVSTNTDELASAATSSTGVGYRHRTLSKDQLMINAEKSNGVESSSAGSASGHSSSGSSPNNTITTYNSPTAAVVAEYGPAGYRTSAVARQEMLAAQQQRFAGPPPPKRTAVSFERTLAAVEPSFIDGEDEQRPLTKGGPLVSIV